MKMKGLEWWQEVNTKLQAKGVRMAFLPIFLSTGMNGFASWNNSVLSFYFILFIIYKIICLFRFGDILLGELDGLLANPVKLQILNSLIKMERYSNAILFYFV